jgi:hypothetical protein
MKEEIEKMYSQALYDDLPPNVFADQVLRLFSVVGRSELFCECGDCQRNIVSGLFCTKCNKKYKR